MLLLLQACTPAPTVVPNDTDTTDPGRTDTVEDIGDAPDTDTDADSDTDADMDTGAEDDGSDAVFDVSAVHTIALDMPAADFADIRDTPRNETWHRATFRWDDEEVADVGVRAFGWGSEVAGKPPLKIAFDHFVPGQRWRGLEQVKLDNCYSDPSFLNERVGEAIFRRAGLAAARTGWARAAVNGDDAGLYAVLEPIDDRFLKRWFGNADGPLYSITDTRGHGLMPLTHPDWYFQTQTSVTSDFSDLVDLTEIVASGTDEELEAVMDLDNFLRESILRSVMGSQDSFSADGNNFYLYDDRGEDPDALHGTWRIIPWDLDQDFARLTIAKATHVDPRTPWTTSDYAYDPNSGAPYEDVLLERQLAMGADVDGLLAEIVDGPMAWDVVRDEILTTADLIRADVQTDPLGYGPSFDRWTADTLLFVHTRLSTLVGREVATCEPPPACSLPASELSPAGTVGWNALGVDGWGWGGVDQCLESGGNCPGFDIGTEHFCRGLYAHAPSDVTIQVPEGYPVLRGAVGLQVANEACSDGARFEVLQDGVVLWSSEQMSEYDAAVDMGDVPVHAGEVRLVTMPGANNSCDTTAWVDLRVECE